MKINKTIAELMEQRVKNEMKMEEEHPSSIEECIYNVNTDSNALISVHYGGYNESRKDATIRAVTEWDRQDYIPRDAIFIELICPSETPCFSKDDFPEWMRYIPIYGKERNRNLFQKEALWNLATKYTNAEKLFFLDADCMPVDCKDYFRQIFDACAEGKCVHAAWHIIHEGQRPENHDYYSFFADESDVPKGCIRFPGMGYCITRKDFHAMDGFNPYSICGSGDAVFLWESLKSVKQQMTYAKRFHLSLIRQHQPQLEPVVIKNLTVQHNFHGMKTDRGYVWSRYAVEVFGDPKAYCHIDQGGLVAWNDPEFPLKYMVMQKSKMHTKQELYELICDTFKRRLDEIETRSKGNGYEYDPTDRNQFD